MRSGGNLVPAGDVERLGAEISTPITLVVEYAELLRGGALGPLSEAQQSVMSQVIEEMERLAQAIRRTVAHARP